MITEQLRSRHGGKAGKSWYCDETYVRVGGKWCYLYRAIDRGGNLVDSILSEHRDMASAKGFFTQAKKEDCEFPVLTLPTRWHCPDHVCSQVSFADEDKNEYDQNIQIADLNMLNAAIAEPPPRKRYHQANCAGRRPDS